MQKSCVKIPTRLFVAYTGKQGKKGILLDSVSRKASNNSDVRKNRYAKVFDPK